MTEGAARRSARIRFEQTSPVSAVCSVGLITLYYVLSIGTRPENAVGWRLFVAAAIFGAALAFEIRAVVRHDEPIRRAVVSLAVLIPLFVVLHAWIYLTMSVPDPATFGHRMTRTEALHLTVTILSTVGFGDITPKTDLGRIVVMTQMVTGVAMLAVGIRLLLHFGSRAAKERS